MAIFRTELNRDRLVDSMFRLPFHRPDDPCLLPPGISRVIKVIRLGFRCLPHCALAPSIYLQTPNLLPNYHQSKYTQKMYWKPNCFWRGTCFAFVTHKIWFFVRFNVPEIEWNRPEKFYYSSNGVRIVVNTNEGNARCVRAHSVAQSASASSEKCEL